MAVVPHLLIVPRSNIPPEILGSILYAFVFSHSEFWARVRAAVRCSSVCKTWRQSALQDGRLWTSLDCRQHRLTRILLNRSRKFSLSVYIRLVTHDHPKNNESIIASFRQVLENTYRLKELRADFSDKTWESYQLTDLIANVRPDFAALERFECAYYSWFDPGFDISQTWFAYGSPIGLTRLYLIGSHIDWRQLTQFPLEELIINSEKTLRAIGDQWHNILPELAPTLRMLQIGSSDFHVSFPTELVIELPRLQSLDIPVALSTNHAGSSFMSTVRMPIESEIRLRVTSHSTPRLEETMNAHFGHFPVHHAYKLYCGKYKIGLAPMLGPGELSLESVDRSELDLFVSGETLHPAVRAAVRDLEMHRVLVFYGDDYGWPDDRFPKVNMITFTAEDGLRSSMAGLPSFTRGERHADREQQLSYTLIDLLAAATYQVFPEMKTIELHGVHLDDPEVDEYRVLAALRRRANLDCPVIWLSLDPGCSITPNFRAAVEAASPLTTVMFDGNVTSEV
jgi:hypothetical protein